MTNPNLTNKQVADMEYGDPHQLELPVNGWTFDPCDQAWTAKVGPSTWSIVRGDLDNPPTFRPTTHQEN